VSDDTGGDRDSRSPDGDEAMASGVGTESGETSDAGIDIDRRTVAVVLVVIGAAALPATVGWLDLW
jgi:hypothetical protein